MKGVTRTIDAMLDLVLSRSKQERLGNHIVRRARGEDDDDAAKNGEYRLLLDLTKHLNQSPTILDIGANQGDWTVEFRRCLGRAIRGYAFEPAPDNIVALRQNLKDAQILPEVEIVAVALGNTIGTARFHVTGARSGSNSLHYRGGLPKEKELTVSIETGDAFCSRAGIEYIDFAKIDTEGSEYDILLGFESMLKKRRIRMLQFEYGGTWIDARRLLKDAFSLLQGHEYKLGKIMPNGVAFTDRYTQALETFRYSNWIAIAPDQEQLTAGLIG